MVTRRPRAFTLVELALVVAITGIIVAVAVPRFANSTARYRTELAADRVMRDIRLARERAITTGAAQDVVFSNAGISYTIIGMNNPDKAAAAYTVPLASDPYLIASMTADFGGSQTLRLNGFGIPVNPGSVTIDARGTSKKISIAAGSGEVSIQ